MKSSMSSLAPENLLAAQKAGLDTSFGLVTRAVEGFEKLIDLNTRTLRTAIDEQQEVIARTLSVRDAQKFFALQNQQIQASVQRAQAYWQSVAEIATDVHGVYVEAAQAQLENASGRSTPPHRDDRAMHRRYWDAGTRRARRD